MLYPFIYNDNDAYCLHGWCVFFMYILNGDFVANLNIAVNVDQEIDANLTNSRSVLQVVFNRYHPLLRFSKHDFPLLFETIVLWSWNWPFNTLENVHGKNELDLGKTLISINSLNSLNYIKLLNKIFNVNPHNFSISWNSSFSISMHSVSNLLQRKCMTHCVDIYLQRWWDFSYAPPFCHCNRHRYCHRQMSDGHQHFNHSRFSKNLHVAHTQER